MDNYPLFQLLMLFFMSVGFFTVFAAIAYVVFSVIAGRYNEDDEQNT